MGRSLSTGRGATRAALTWRAVRLDDFFPGYSNSQRHVPRGRLCLVLACAYLVEVGADPSLPVLAEVCDPKSVVARRLVARRQMQAGLLTVVHQLLVVLDRLEKKKESGQFPRGLRRVNRGQMTIPLCLLAIKLGPVVDVR